MTLARFGPPVAVAGALFVLLLVVFPSSGPATGAAAAGETASIRSTSGFVHWSTFHGAENRSGYSPLPGPSAPNGVWFACPSGFPVRDAPVADATFVYTADELGTVFALNRSNNGSTAWNRSVGSSATQLDVSGSNVYVGSSTGDLFDLKSSNGSVGWKVSLGSPIVQGVAVVGGNVVVGTGGGSLEAFDASTGALAWNTSLGNAVAGAVASEGSGLFVPTANGTVDRLDSMGRLLWSTRVGAPVDTAVAVSGPDVFVGDLHGGLTDLWSSNGSLRWAWSSAEIGTTDAIEATPAVDPARVYVAADSGSLRAYDRANGSLEWQTPGEYTGLPNDVPPAVTPTGLYAVLNGVQEVVDLEPSTGRAIWNETGPVFVFGAPGVDNGELLFGTDFGCVEALGPPGANTPWPVSGVVERADGSPIPNASITIGTRSTSTDARGSFSLGLRNGTYALEAFASGFTPLEETLVVAGPTTNLTLVLRPLTLYPVTGQVVDGWSGSGLEGVVVDAVGPFGYDAEVTTGTAGTFTVDLPNGTTTLSVAAFGSYGGASVPVDVLGAPLGPVRVAVGPTGSELGNSPGWPYPLALPVAALALAGAAAGLREHDRRRGLVGLPPGLLSPFARFVVMRLLLLVAQVVALLAVVYLFGTLLPIAATHGSASVIDPSVGPSCYFRLSDLGCDLTAYAHGFGTLLIDLFEGNWGWAKFGALHEPVTTYLQWWLPDSIQLGAISLAISMAVAYPLAMIAGWRRKGAFDVASRLASLAGLLVPSFLLTLLILLAFGTRFLGAFGDLPFGTLPSDPWFLTHGGLRDWVGTGDSTSPTHFPLVDGAIHRDWAFEQLVAAKVLLQAGAISVVYLTIFLRHAWSVVSHASHEPHVQAARARGVPEGTLLWRHTARRVLPYYVQTFAITLPAFVGTQAVVEALFNAQGIGAIMLLEITNLTANPPGFTGPITGNFYQVIIFFLVLLILVSTLLADIIARYLDPRLRSGAR
jgi:ABC-type dipeptide/oligopeptide/nickel transport system permease component/outer membrane protein assembly factor BamB